MDPRAKALLSGKRALNVFNAASKLGEKDQKDFQRLIVQAVAGTPMKPEKQMLYMEKAVNALQGRRPKTIAEALETTFSLNLPSQVQGNIKAAVASEIKRRMPFVTEIDYNGSVKPLFGSRYGTGRSPFAVAPEKGPFDK